MRLIVSMIFCVFFSMIATPVFSQCPQIGYADGCSIVIEIRPDGSLRFRSDPSVLPYDNIEDTLIGVVNNSGATIFGISLTGNGIFGFDGDGAGDPTGSFWGDDSPFGPFPGGPFGPTGYEGPGTLFMTTKANTGMVNFTDGLDDKGFLWFSLEGSPSSINLSRTVTVDPGHGGTQCKRDKDGNPVTGGDTGATGTTNFTTAPTGRLTEHALAFAIGVSLQMLLTTNGDSVTMTRTDDTHCPTLDERVEIANNANTNVFVSIHFNGAAPSANGSQVWYQPSKSSSKTFASLTVDKVASGLGLANRGPKRAGIDGKNLRVLNQTDMSSILAEIAFLSNVGDQVIMHRSTSVNTAAKALMAGIEAFFNQ